MSKFLKRGLRPYREEERYLRMLVLRWGGKLLAHDMDYQQYIRAVWIKAITRVGILLIIAVIFLTSGGFEYVRKLPPISGVIGMLLAVYTVTEYGLIRFKQYRAQYAAVIKIGIQDGILFLPIKRAQDVEERVQALSHLLERI